GLDDLSCSQCVSLLKQVAAGGRTVICSIHTPSAKLFSLFDNVYVISSGQCTYQGYGPDIVPYLINIGISCPTHYNPADFIMEVCSGEYGDCQDRMVSAIDNGRNQNINNKLIPLFDNNSPSGSNITQLEPQIFECVLNKECKNSEWDQFRILLMRMWLQISYRDTVRKKGIFQQMVQLKFLLLCYECVLFTSPTSFGNFISYHGRIIPFYGICFLTSFISESFGLLISSTLNLVNGMFVGPVMMVPFIVFSGYGFGSRYSSIPVLIRILMRFSYLRYSFEALVLVMLRGRKKLDCPENEEFCFFTDLDLFIEIMAMDHGILWVDILALVAFLVVVRSASYYLLRQRLAPNKTFMALQYIARFVKTRMGGGR
ncbi:ABC2 membrane domain containing protein, partial [Asbolus verrucosus]